MGNAAPQEQAELSEEYLDALLEKYDNLGPKIGSTTDEVADGRIRVEIAKMPEELQIAGLWSINKVLKEEKVPPSVRLHLITAVVHLSLIAQKQRTQ